MLWGRSRLRPGVAVAACAVAASVLSSGAQGATIDIGVVVASPVTLGEGESLDNAGIIDTGAAGIAVVTVPIAPIEQVNVPTILNRETGEIIAGYEGIVVNGTLGLFDNRGTISSGLLGGGGAVVVGGAIDTFRNANRIVSANDDAVKIVYNYDLGATPPYVRDFLNTGEILGAGAGVYAEGGIGAFVNRGKISGDGSSVIIIGDVDTFRNDSLLTSIYDVAVELDGTTKAFLNTGRIEGFDGIAANEVTTLTNAAGASVIGNGDCGFPCGVAINALTTDVLDNAGTIAGGSAGAMLMDARIVRNSGRISGGEQGLTIGALPYVPIAFPGVTTDIVNFASGVIEATDPGGCGCFPTVGLSFVNGTLNNMGTIRGGIGVAIVGDGTTGVIVTNSGKIEGFTPVTMLGTHDVSMAMLFDTYDFRDPYDPDANNLGLVRDDTLILLPGSQILGAVDYANGFDTLDLRQYQGNQALLNFNLEQVLTGPSVTGQSIFGNTTFVVTVDDTALKTAAPTQFNSFTKGVFRSIRGASGGNPVGTAATPLAYAPSFSTPAGDAASDLAGGEDVANEGKVWVGSFGDLARDDTALRAFSQQLGGVVVGAHAALDRNTRLGVVVSGGSSIYATDLRTQTIRGALGALGLYGDTDLGPMTADFALLGGAAANHSERSLTGIFGNETAVADYTGWFVSPALGVAIPLLALEAVDTQADVRVRYLGGQTGAYTETGSSMNLSVPAQTVSLAEARAGFTASAEMDALTLSATVGALVQSNLGGTTTSFTLVSPSGSLPLSSTTPGTTTAGLYGGASLDLALGTSARVTATAGAEIRTDGFRSIGGSVNLGGTF